MPAKQELEDGDSESASMEAGPGGLVGLIASLSGVLIRFVRNLMRIIIICFFVFREKKDRISEHLSEP